MKGSGSKALEGRGRYYLIQFGHNDEPGKGPERETIRKPLPFVHDEVRGRIRAIGATPILVTSLVRRIYNTNGTIKTTQTPYVEAVRALAAEKHVPLIDLHAISLADAENAGDDVWADLSLATTKATSIAHAPQRQGSDVVGRIGCEALRTSVPELGMLFRVAGLDNVSSRAFASDSPPPLRLRWRPSLVT
jgi:pectinesterase